MLRVEVEDFVSSAVLLCDRVADPVCEAVGALTSTLDRCAAMAGDDPGGREWAAGYDDSARSVLDATQQIVNGMYRTSTLLGRSAANYAQAEAASTAGGDGDRMPQLLSRIPGERYLGPATAPGAAGGGGDPPTGWWLVAHTVGYLWPNGHQDRLRTAARAWFDSADALDDAAGLVGYAGASFVVDGLPEADDIVVVCTGLHERLLNLSDAHRALSSTCTELAVRLDRCHTEAEDALAELLGETAGIQVVGGIIGAASFGIAEGPTQAVQAARIAAVAARVGRIVDRFAVNARHLAQGLAAVKAAAEDVGTVVRRILGVDPVPAAVTRAPRLTRAGDALDMTRDAGKGVRLTRDARKELAAAERLEEAGLVPRAPTFGRPSEFTPPKVFRNRHGQLTNGEFTVSPTRMAPHTSGSNAAGKSQFFTTVDSDKAVLDAASYAKRHQLFVDGKAKVFVENGPVGVLGRSGEPTQWINVYTTRSGLVHGSPGGP